MKIGSSRKDRDLLFLELSSTLQFFFNSNVKFRIVKLKKRSPRSFT